MFYVYILKSAKDSLLYIGYTSDLKKRIAEHNDGKNRSTKARTPFRLVYYEAYASSSDAKYRERQLKRFSGATTHLKKRITNSLTRGSFM